MHHASLDELSLCTVANKIFAIDRIASMAGLEALGATMARVLARRNGARELAEFLTSALEDFVRTSDTAATEATAAWSQEWAAAEADLLRRCGEAERSREEAERRAEAAEKLATSSYDDGWVNALRFGCQVAETAARQRHRIGPVMRPAGGDCLWLGRKEGCNPTASDCFYKVVRVSTDQQDVEQQDADVRDWIDQFTLGGDALIGGSVVHASAWEADTGTHKRMPYWYHEAVQMQQGLSDGVQCFLVVRQVSRLSRDFDTGVRAARLLLDAGWQIVVCGQEALENVSPWEQFMSHLAASSVASSEKSLDGFMRGASRASSKFSHPNRK